MLTRVRAEIDISVRFIFLEGVLLIPLFVLSTVDQLTQEEEKGRDTTSSKGKAVFCHQFIQFRENFEFSVTVIFALFCHFAQLSYVSGFHFHRIIYFLGDYT